jgi:hypothetical protein
LEKSSNFVEKYFYRDASGQAAEVPDTSGQAAESAEGKSGNGVTVARSGRFHKNAGP